MSLSIAGYLTLIGIAVVVVAILLDIKSYYGLEDLKLFLFFCGITIAVISGVSSIADSVSGFNGFQTILHVENTTDAPLKVTVIKNRPFMNLYISHEIVMPGETCIMHYAKHVSTRPLKDNDVAEESDIGAAYRKAISEDK